MVYGRGRQRICRTEESPSNSRHDGNRDHRHDRRSAARSLSDQGDDHEQRHPEGLLLGAVGLGTYLTVRGAVRSGRWIDLHGRTVLITGGSRGLGLVLARQLAARGAGSRSAPASPTNSSAPATTSPPRGAEVVAVPCDVTDQEQVETMVRTVLDRFDSDRHPDQQRGHDPGRAVRGHDRRGLRAGAQDPLLGAALHDARRHSLDAEAGPGADRQHLLDRRQGEPAAPAPLQREQVRAHRLLRRAARRAGQGRDPGDDRDPGPDAHRQPAQRPVQGPAPGRVRLVQHQRLAPHPVDRAPRPRPGRSSRHASTATRS